MKRWYCVRTEIQVENRVAIAVAKIGCPTFLPLHYTMRRDGKWLVPEQSGLLFPRYVFVIVHARGHLSRDGKRLENRIDRLDDVWGEIREVRGVERIMGRTDGTPVAIPYRQMRSLRLASRKATRRKKAAAYTSGQKLKVTGGNFAGFDGIYEGTAHQRVRVLLSLFGRETAVEMDESDVRAA